jgi:hypothetical protein
MLQYITPVTVEFLNFVNRLVFLRNTVLRNLDLFPPSGKKEDGGGGHWRSWVRLKQANLNHWT